MLTTKTKLFPWKQTLDSRSVLQWKARLWVFSWSSMCPGPCGDDYAIKRSASADHKVDTIILLAQKRKIFSISVWGEYVANVGSLIWVWETSACWKDKELARPLPSLKIRSSERKREAVEWKTIDREVASLRAVTSCCALNTYAIHQTSAYVTYLSFFSAHPSTSLPAWCFSLQMRRPHNKGKYL